MTIQFAPPVWHGEPSKFTRFDIYPWIKQISKYKKVYCVCWANWMYVPDLPSDYDYYLITFPLENINLPWLEHQRQLVDGKFIVVHAGRNYDYNLKNTTFITYLEWHNHFDQMIEMHSVQPIKENKKYKFSAICNRVSQSKAWMTAKLLDVAPEDSLVYINTWIESKNVHNWELTGNKVLDELTLLYRERHENTVFNDGFSQFSDQRYNSNPWHDIYNNTALHFVLCSFHYSYMSDYIYPGPDIDEKTLKCLLGGVPFIACGQFDIYTHLRHVGFEFDYGFNLDYDKDPGNLSRFETITHLIDQLAQMPKEEIVDVTRKSTHNNRDYIIKKGLHARCEQLKSIAIEQILDQLG
jgi:hypothetical protein